MASYQHALWGTQTSEHDDTIIYRSNGRRWKVRIDSKLPENFSIEGCFFCTTEYAQDQFGPNPDRLNGRWRVGDTGRATLLLNNRMVKGHFMCWDMDVDVTCWDSRCMSSDEVFVGFMGPLHSGDLKFNIQPIVNFGFQKFAVEFGQRAMMEFREEMKNTNGLLKQASRMFAADLNGEGSDQLNRWRLMAAIKDGFDPRTQPFMRRDLYRAYRKDLLNIENMRIPVPQEFGIRAYYFIDPWTIGRDGRFHPERKRLVGNCVYSPRLDVGERVAAYRDPQTPPEYWLMENVGPYAGFPLIDHNAMIVSIYIAMNFAKKQGGGDYDDCGNIVRKMLMEHFVNNLPRYVEQPDGPANVAAKVLRWVEDNIFAQADG